MKAEKEEALAWEERKMMCLKTFGRLTEDLQAKLSQEDLAGTLKLLAQREEVIREVDELDRRKVDSGRGSPSGGHLPSQTGEFLQEAASRNEDCLERLSSWRRSLKAKLLDMRSGVNASRAYHGRVILQPRFLDLKK